MFSVLYWGSHPDLDNDDCWTGDDFDTREAAEVVFKRPCDPGKYCRPESVEFIVLTQKIDGVDCFVKLRANPTFDKNHAKKFDDEWRQEMAMEAGMLHGIDAYNEVLGY